MTADIARPDGRIHIADEDTSVWLEVLTVEHVDSNGGFHGSIFVLPVGKATSLWDQLVAQGAKVSTHVEPSAPQEQKQ